MALYFALWLSPLHLIETLNSWKAWAGVLLCFVFHFFSLYASHWAWEKRTVHFIYKSFPFKFADSQSPAESLTVRHTVSTPYMHIMNRCMGRVVSHCLSAPNPAFWTLALWSWDSLQSRFSFAICQRGARGRLKLSRRRDSFLHTCWYLRVSPVRTCHLGSSNWFQYPALFCTFPESEEAQLCRPLSSCDDSTSEAVTPSPAVDVSAKLLGSKGSNLCPLLSQPLVW